MGHIGLWVQGLGLRVQVRWVSGQELKLSYHNMGKSPRLDFPVNSAKSSSTTIQIKAQGFRSMLIGVRI